MIKKVILGILAVILIVIVAFCALVAMQPADYKISRSTTVNAPPEKIFEQVNDFHNWEAWSPWAKLDPTMKTTYSGPGSGQGASYSWVGNSQVGEGKMTITESSPGQHIKIDLEFIKPWQATNDTEFMFKPNGDKTDVTWTMSGHNNFAGKAFGLVMNMDEMIGGDFDKGLAQLKTIAEAAPKQ
ncbi:MAG: SRPBCC family protein [Candidatus Binatia bacterium]